MNRRRLQTGSTTRQKVSPRFLIILICIDLIILIIWMRESENQKIISNRTSKLIAPKIQSSGLKYMLLWTNYDFAPFYHFKHGQSGFIEKKCSVINCYVTPDRNFFNGDLTKFEAIAFNGRNIIDMDLEDLPKDRSVQQKYIYFSTESADYYPVCTKIYDNFFNWTATYRLDSDIPFPYIKIKNIKEITGPIKKFKWVDFFEEKHVHKWQNKTKAVAWFVSNCASRSKRGRYAKRLKRALSEYGLTLDIYGDCGTLKCPRSINDACDAMLERDYYFYLSFENSFSKDYVTEKLLRALQNNVVPIVLGGADYTRFLPPYSYINANRFSPEGLADTINAIIMSPKTYNEFHRWRKYYEFYDPSTTDCICAVCAALNNNTFLEKTSFYNDFRSWWNPDYKTRCRT